MPQAIAISDYHNSIDDIDLKISLLSHELNATEYELLVLIREFDERMGWLRCGSRNCAQWLQWRCDIGAVAAREKVRVANASSCDCDTTANEHEESVSAETRYRSLPAADHYQVMVHVDESALTSVSPEGQPESKGLSQFPIEVVKRLCCDGSVVAVVENEHGEPLSIGRKQRTVSPAIRRALRARDRGCSFPGCGDTRFVEAHHLKHWSIGGETSVENCCLLCSHHHKLVHEGGFTVTRATPDQSTSKRAGYNQANSGQLIFKRPDGRVIPPFGYRTSDWQDEGGEESPVIYLISNNKGKHPQHLPHPTDQ